MWRRRASSSLRPQRHRGVDARGAPRRHDARSDAVDVYVTAEALDAAGKVIASGVSYVGAVSAGSSSAFIIKVPKAGAAANFRVLVTSFRFGFSQQS